jgi:uncharacterized protein (TIGR00369 family)
MKPLSKPDASQLAALRAAAHPRCVVCSRANPSGLGLECTVMPDGSVQGEFVGSEVFEGYVGRLHGGVIAALLDGAMTNCLLAHGCEAFTAELTVRYRHPAAAKERVSIRAWRTDSRAALHLLRAELRQNGHVIATAVGKFMETHE